MDEPKNKTKILRWRARAFRAVKKVAGRLAVGCLVLLAVVLVLGAGLLAFAHLFPQSFAPAFVSAVQKASGASLSVSDFSLSPLSFLKFRMAGRNVTLADKETGVAIARAKSFAVTLDLSGILKRRIPVSDLLLSSPRAALAMGPDKRITIGGIPLTGGKGSRWKATLDRAVVEDGALSLSFPPGFSMPPVTLDQVSAGFALPLMGMGLDVKGRVLWAGNEGEIRLTGAGAGKDYQASFAFSQIPLNGFTIPGDPKSFSDIPVSGSLTASGVIWRNNAQDITGKLSFGFAGLCLNNKAAPDGKVLADPFSGTASFAYNPATGFRASGNISELNLAFSRFSGRFSLAKVPEQPLAYAVSLAGTDFVYKDFRPYLTCFLQRETGRWLTERLADAEISSLRVLLRGPRALTDPKAGGPLFLRAAADVKGVTLWASPDSEPIKNISGHLAFFTEHMEGHGLFAQAPGAVVKGGELAIMYGGYEGTPMKLAVGGHADTGTLWPWVQTLVRPEGFLSRMGLSGPADVSFSWFTDLDGKEKDDFSVGVDARGMTIAFEKGGEHPLTLVNTTGNCGITPHNVSFSHLSVGLADARAEADGVFGTDGRTATDLHVDAHGLTAFLPFYADPLHPMRAWFPRELSARVELLKAPDQNGVSPLRVPFVLTDERGKSLSGEFFFSDSGWSVEKVAGGVGALALAGNLESDGNCKLAVSAGAPALHRAELSVNNHAGALFVSASRLKPQDWKLWKIPGPGRELFLWTDDRLGRPGASDLPFNKIAITASSPLVWVSDDLTGPFSLTGMVAFSPEFALDAKKVAFGPRNLSFSYRRGKDSDLVRASGNGGSLSEYAAIGKWGASLAGNGPDDSGRGLSASMALVNVTAPGLAAGSYTAEVRFARSANGYDFSVKAGCCRSDLDISARKRGTNLSANVASRRLDLPAILTVARALQGLEPSSPSALTTADLTVSVGDLSFSPELAGPFSAHAALSFNKQKFRADVSRFSLLGHTGKALYSMAGSQSSLSLTLSELILPDLVNKAKAVARVKGLDFALNRGGTMLSSVDFSVDAPRVRGADGSVVPFAAAGTAVFSPGQVSVTANRFTLGPQKGVLSVSKGENDLRVRADFSFLDLQALDELMTGKADDGAAEKAGPGKKIAFAWEPPKGSIEVDLSAATLKFWRTSFESLEFEGRVSPDRAVVSGLSWQKKKKQVFSLEGEMDRKPDNQWTYSVQSQFQDLGDVTKLLVSRPYKAKEHFPIQGGQTTAGLVGSMGRGPDKLWVPKGRITFESKEGTINVGGRFLMVLGALSPQNYLRAITGERTELSGEGAVFKTMKGVLDFDGDKITVTDFFFESPSLRYVAYGTVDLAAYTENLHICMQPFGSLNKIISYAPGLSWVLLSKDGAIFETCIGAEGNIASPKVYPIPQSMIPTRLGDLFNRK